MSNAVEALDYCRQIEAYLCQKNDGHLMRVVGPAFEIVSAWSAEGIPFKVACEGIDRYVERYYRKGPRRRPVRIEFCDADVRDVFDAWRRATGLTVAAPAAADGGGSERRGPSLPEHLERALLRLTDARVSGRLGPDADPLIDAVSQALDEARAASGGLRGERRQSLLRRLSDLDLTLTAIVDRAVDDDTVATIERDALAELDAFRTTMPSERFDRALEMARDRLLRARLGLPSLKFL